MVYKKNYLLLRLRILPGLTSQRREKDANINEMEQMASQPSFFAQRSHHEQNANLEQQKQKNYQVKGMRFFIILIIITIFFLDLLRRVFEMSFVRLRLPDHGVVKKFFICLFKV